MVNFVWGMWVKEQKNTHTHTHTLAGAGLLKSNVHFLWGLDEKRWVFQIEPATTKKEKNFACLQ